ncbi:MAG: hypothetical protein IIZ73_09600 [Ruminococcus sp.]|nr:hypothetical protein [Ruminococcus sp.]
MTKKLMMELEQEVCNLECDLRASDYEIIKAYEYEKCGIKAPYDIDSVHKERQAKRDRINEIQKLLDGGDKK